MSEVSPPQDSARSLHDESRRLRGAHKVIKNLILETVQLMFDEGNPLRYRWDEDQTKTQIIIVDKYSFNLDQVGARPAVVANRGPQQWDRSFGFRQMQEIDMRTDRRVHTNLIKGSIVLSCFSRQGLEAEDIAGYIFEGLEEIRDVLRKIGSRGRMSPGPVGFFRIEAASMGEEALVKSDSREDLSVVPVAVQVMVQRRWATQPHARKLQGIITRTRRSDAP